RASLALGHPLLAEGGLLLPLVAAMAQWHLLDISEHGRGRALMDAVKKTLQEADRLKCALVEASVAPELRRCIARLNRLQTVVACVGGKLLGGLISGGIGAVGAGEVPNDCQAAVEEYAMVTSAWSSMHISPAGSGLPLGVPPDPGAVAAKKTAGGGGSGGGFGSGGRGSRDWLRSKLLANGLA
ncbi:unnamed protein product, partial [Discosporangium mesarthrocarpum]